MAPDQNGLIYGWCWADPFCVSAATAAASSVIAMARRLDTLEEWSKGKKRIAALIRHLAAGTIISGGASFGLCLIGVSQWPEQHKLIAALVILAALIVDWGSDSGRLILRRLILTFTPTAGRLDQATRPDSSSETTDSAKGSK